MEFFYTRLCTLVFQGWRIFRLYVRGDRTVHLYSNINICVLCFRDTAVEFVCRTHVTIVDSMTSLNTDYVLMQTRRCATLLLLFAAFWSLVSTFVPTSAQPRSCTPFSWLTLKDVLDKIARLEHYGSPPT